MKKHLSILFLCLFLFSAVIPGCVLAQSAAKYVFLFIGDGQSLSQITAARDYLGTIQNPESEVPLPGDLSFTDFPFIGLMTNYDATSFCPDSSSAGSAMASGRKIQSGTLNYSADLSTPLKPICEYIKEQDEGRKVGIATTVTLDHATPGAFYAKALSRNDYYEIALQGIGKNSVLDFLGGGTFWYTLGENGDQKNLYDIARENGFTVADTGEAIRALNAESGRVVVSAPGRESDGTLYYAIDAGRHADAGEDVLALPELVSAAIRVLDNENGFFLMVEGGKVDWAQHANDAVTGIYETINFSDAVQVAVDFAKAHPDETLIVVTGDHETGGLSIGWAGTHYDTHFEYLSNQQCSYAEFDKRVWELRETGGGFSQALGLIEAAFGLTMATDSPLTLTQSDLEMLEYTYELSMISPDDRVLSEEDLLLYYMAEPLTAMACRILDNRAGLSYSTFSHSGLPLPVYAMGVGAERFAGAYDNTDIFYRLAEVMGLNVD